MESEERRTEVEAIEPRGTGFRILHTESDKVEVAQENEGQTQHEKYVWDEKMPPSGRKRSGDAVVNDSPVGCQSRGVTEPQRDGGPRQRWKEPAKGVFFCKIGLLSHSPSVSCADSSLPEGAT